MNISDLLPERKQKESDLYWAIVLEQGWVQAGLWEVVDHKAIIRGVATGVAWESVDQITDATDTVLSSVVQNITGEISEPSKTVFGLPPSWISGGAIKEENLPIIKKICADLELSPSGFVVLPEAIAHLLKSEEGAPINAIIVGLGKDEVDVTLFQLGTLIGTTNVARSVSLSDDVIEGLSRFNPNSPFPSRILIYNGRKHQLEEEKQNLLSADWTGHEKLKFLHTPKIEIIEPDRKILATALAGGAEIAQATEVVGLTKEPSDDTEIKQTEEEAIAAEGAIVNEVQKPIDDMGFVVDKDIANLATPANPPRINTEPGLNPQGFEAPRPPFTSPLPLRANALAPITGIFSKFTKIVPNLLAKFKAPKSHDTIPMATNQSFSRGGNRRFLIPLILLGLIGAVFVLWYIFIPKAEVTVFVSPKKVIQKDISVSVDTKITNPDLSKPLLPGESMSVTVSGEKTKGTTGTKVVGDKSHGNIKIENGTDGILRVPAGTIVLSSGGLKFSTDTAASVSAALSPGSPGTISVNVTAADIGSEYNLAKDEVFKVGNFPKAEVDAVATADFSGGTSRQIAAVSANDLASLEKDLTLELTDQAKNQIESKLASDKIVIDDSFEITPVTKTFSGKQGDEASSVKLKMSLTVNALTVKKSQIFEVVSKLLTDKVSKGFILRSEQVKYLFTKKDEKGSLVNFSLEVDANLLPETKPEDIAKKITGKSPQEAQEFLTTIPGFSRVEIKLKPKIPFGLGRIPLLTKNITVEVSSEK